LATARQVIVVGHRASQPTAALLRRNLAQVRGQTVLAPAPGQSLSDDLVGLGVNDVVVVVSFRRHAAGTVAAIEAMRSDGVRVLLLADSTLRHLAARATWWIECPLVSAGAFDSYVVPASVVAMLSDLVHTRLDGAGERIETIDRRYTALREIEDP
jgi:DNA-binding MurR/RpiR family transcriptional regulator